MGIFIIIATLILISGWKYQGPINNYTSGSFGTGIGFFAGFFGVPTGPLTGLFFLSLKEDIKIIPVAAITMAINVLTEIFSLKKIYASKAATKGIAPNIIKVTAAVVVVIENTNVILAIPRQAPPINPEKPIF